MKKNSITATRDILVTRFPRCFLPQGASCAKIPLKVGIRADVARRCPDIPWQAIHSALGDYCRGERYQGALKEGSFRIDLDGLPAGFVTASHAAFATGKAAS